MVGFVWNVISVIGMFWMPESPRYLVGTGRLDEAREVFQTIARWNNVKIELDQSEIDERFIQC